MQKNSNILYSKMDSVVDIVKAIIEGKRNGRHHPEIALDYEIDEIYSGDNLIGELEAMVVSGVLRRGRTINNNYYTIPPKKLNINK